MGHPDGQDYAVWRSSPLIDQANFALSATNPLNAQGTITQFQSLAIYAKIIGGLGAIVEGAFYTDSTATHITFDFRWRVPAVSILQVGVPIMGNFVKLSITTTSAPALSLSAFVEAMNTPVPSPQYINVANKVEANSVSLAPNAQSDLPFPYIGAGRCHVFAQDIGSSGKLNLSVWETDETGANLAQIDHVGAMGAQTELDFVMPAVPAHVLVTNTDGAASHNFNLFAAIEQKA